jgi:hypothetical protein
MYSTCAWLVVEVVMSVVMINPMIDGGERAVDELSDGVFFDVDVIEYDDGGAALE